MTAQKLSLILLGILLGATLLLLWALGGTGEGNSAIEWPGLIAFGLLLVVVSVADRSEGMKPLLDGYRRQASDAETAKANAEAATALAETDKLAAEADKATAVAAKTAAENDTAVALRERDLARRDRTAAADLAARLAPLAEALQTSLVVGNYTTADKAMAQVAIDLGPLTDSQKADILNVLVAALAASHAGINLEDLEK